MYIRGIHMHPHLHLHMHVLHIWSSSREQNMPKNIPLDSLLTSQTSPTHVSWEPETFHCGNGAVVAIIFHFWLLDLCLSLLSDPKDSGELLQSFTTCAQQVPSPELSSSSGELEKFHWPTTLVDYYHLAESDTRGSSGMWYPATQQPKQQKK